MKDFDAYKVDMPFPNRRNFTIYYFYKDGEVMKFTQQPTHETMKKLYDEGWMKQAKVDDEAHNKARAEYNKAESAMIDQFKRDALDDLGLLNHPKADLLFSKAWEHGHSSGLHEVYSWMDDLSDLITD